MPNTFILFGLLSVIAGILVSGFLYFRQSKNYSKAVSYSLFGLRALAFACLFFVLIAPFFNFKTKEIKQPIIAVLVDNSASMVIGKDSVAIKKELYTTLRESVKSINDAETVFFNFDDELHEGAPTFLGSSTDIAQALKRITAQTDRERLAAVVLVSDGIVNLGVNPLYYVEESFLPVFTVAVGDSARQKDIAVTEVRAPEYVFRGDEIVVDVTVSAENLEAFSGEVKLLFQGQRIDAKTLKVVGNSFAKVYSFSLKASKPGLYSYTVLVEKVADELNVSNNQRQFFIEVIENRKKIVVASSAPAPDVAALREALKKVDAYEVTFQNINTALPLDDKTELAVVFIQPFSNPAAYKKLLQNYNGPLWLIIDPAADAQLIQGQFDWLSKVGRPQGIDSRIDFNKNFGLFKLSKEAEASFSKYPALSVFTGSIRASGSFENLLTDVQGKQVAGYGAVGSRKVVLFNFNGLWHWRMADFKQTGTNAHVDEWLQLTAQYLTTDGNGNRLKLRYEKRISAGNALKIMADVYDATFKETAEALVELKLENEVGEKFNYAFINERNSYETTLTALAEGKYTFLVTAKLGEETLSATGAFFVEGTTLEALTTRANYTLLQQIAQATDGSFYTLNTVEGMAADLNNHPKLKPVESVKTQSLALIDLKYLFFIMLLLFSAEWFLRRYFGRI